MNEFRRTHNLEQKGKGFVALMKCTSSDPESVMEPALLMLDLICDRWKKRFALARKRRDPIPRGDLPWKKRASLYALTASKIARLNRWLGHSHNRFVRLSTGLRRWSAAMNRRTSLDSLLDCMSTLEAIAGLGSSEIRLRLSMYAASVVRTHRAKAFMTVYKSYKLRNDFIHGSKIPVISDDEEQELIFRTANVLLSYLDTAAIPNRNKELMLLKKVLGTHNWEEL
jgi:hypothetical protein